MLAEEIYKMGFSFLKKINADLVREIFSHQISAKEFFTLPTKELVARLGIRHEHEFDKISREEALARGQHEWNRIKEHNITPLFILDADYPQKLAETDNAPIILYKLGDADLDGKHMVSVVGTRKPTPYGVESCNKIVDELGDYFPDLEVVSGLAFGIDACAHITALEKNLVTIAVVAHGLNMIYPAAHRNLAKEIIRKGGAILSEYPFDTKPFKPNFLARNRIVAGLSDVTMVIESNVKGGAMSTANYAFIYNRDVMALPGRRVDDLSSGCNLLIRKNKAHLMECAADVIEATGWQPVNLAVSGTDRNLFSHLEGESLKIYQILKMNQEPVAIDDLCYQMSLPASKILSLLGEMEFDGVVMRYPGNRYSPA